MMNCDLRRATIRFNRLEQRCERDVRNAREVLTEVSQIRFGCGCQDAEARAQVRRLQSLGEAIDASFDRRKIAEIFRQSLNSYVEQ